MAKCLESVLESCCVNYWNSFLLSFCFDLLFRHPMRLDNLPFPGVIEFQREQKIGAESILCLTIHLCERSANNQRARVRPPVWLSVIPKQTKAAGFLRNALSLQLCNFFRTDSFLNLIIIAG